MSEAPTIPVPEQLVPGERVLIATIGVGVAAHEAGLFADAVASEALRCGYRAVVTESGTVSGMRPDVNTRRGEPALCPDCLRTVGRYPGGRYYRHHCQPAGQRWEIPLPYDKPLLSENDRLHWSKRHERTQQLRSDAWKLAKHHKLPRCEKVRVTLHWQPAVHRPRDEENPTPTLKALCDGLTDAALVPADTHDLMVKRIEIHDPEQGKPARLWLTIDALEVTG